MILGQEEYGKAGKEGHTQRRTIMQQRSVNVNWQAELWRLARKPLTALALLAVSAAGFGLAMQSKSETQTACQSNLKQVALGMLMYAQDYDERFPPTKTPAHMHNRVVPYVKNRKMFTCPETGEAYLPNPALNCLDMSKIDSPATLMMLRDDKPHITESGKPGWNIAYSDGHVKLSMTEIALGKLAPEPSRAVRLQSELRFLQAAKRNIEARIRRVEAEQRRTVRKR
jgi:hypothetical protein